MACEINVDSRLPNSCGPQKLSPSPEVSLKRPPSPGDTRDVSRPGPVFSLTGIRLATCAGGHWPEQSPGGSGANCEAAQIRTLPLPRSDSDIDHAASAARQISGSVARRPPSLPNLNCPFLAIFAQRLEKVKLADFTLAGHRHLLRSWSGARSLRPDSAPRGLRCRLAMSWS